MLIDKIDRKLLETTFGISFGTVFYIDEDPVSFGEQGEFIKGKTFDDLLLPQKMPYDTFIIHLKDGFITYRWDEPEDKPGPVIMCDSFSINKQGMIGRVCPNPDVVMAYEFTAGMMLDAQRILLINRYDQSVSEICHSDANDGRWWLPFYVLFQFLSFLSCKNIAVEDVKPPKKLQKRRVKKKKLPMVSYKVLKVKNVGKSSHGSSGGYWSNRIHLCRGHVREYSPDRPLFGKLFGRFWIPPHARGNKKLGTVQKDYALCT